MWHPILATLLLSGIGVDSVPQYRTLSTTSGLPVSYLTSFPGEKNYGDLVPVDTDFDDEELEIPAAKKYKKVKKTIRNFLRFLERNELVKGTKRRGKISKKKRPARKSKKSKKAKTKIVVKPVKAKIVKAEKIAKVMPAAEKKKVSTPILYQGPAILSAVEKALSNPKILQLLKSKLMTLKGFYPWQRSTVVAQPGNSLRTSIQGGPSQVLTVSSPTQRIVTIQPGTQNEVYTKYPYSGMNSASPQQRTFFRIVELPQSVGSADPGFEKPPKPSSLLAKSYSDYGIPSEWTNYYNALSGNYGDNDLNNVPGFTPWESENDSMEDLPGSNTKSTLRRLKPSEQALRKVPTSDEDSVEDITLQNVVSFGGSEINQRNVISTSDQNPVEHTQILTTQSGTKGLRHLTFGDQGISQVSVTDTGNGGLEQALLPPGFIENIPRGTQRIVLEHRHQFPKMLKIELSENKKKNTGMLPSTSEPILSKHLPMLSTKKKSNKNERAMDQKQEKIEKAEKKRKTSKASIEGEDGKKKIPKRRRKKKRPSATTMKPKVTTISDFDDTIDFDKKESGRNTKKAKEKVKDSENNSDLD